MVSGGALVEDRDATERSARPLGKIGFELRVQCLNERACDRNLESRTGDGTLSIEVHD